MKKFLFTSVVLIVAFLAVSCGPVFLERIGPNNAAPPPGEVPKSLTGELLPGARAVITGRAISNWDAIFNGIDAEYADFYKVALVSYNYSKPLDDELLGLNRLINAPLTAWTKLSNKAPFTRETKTDGGPGLSAGIFRVNDDLTEWEWITVTPEITRHLRVSKSNGTKHTWLLMWHYGGGMNANDTVEIVENGRYKVTRTISAAGLDGAVYGRYNPQSSGGTVTFTEFIGVTQDDTDLRTLAINRTSSASVTAPVTAFNFGPVVVNSYLVGALDSRQLLIRPDAPLPVPLGNYNGTDFTVRNDYSGTLTSQSETFDPSLFPNMTVVKAALNVGITPLWVAGAFISSDGSYNYTFPAWSLADIGL